MLSYDEKTIKRIVLQFMNFEKNIKICVNTEQDVKALIAFLRYESTILFHVGEVNYIYYPSRKVAVLYPNYIYTKSEYDAMVVKMTAIVEKIRGQILSSANSLYERELCIHDALCTNVLYADMGDESHSIVGPLLCHKGVCDGISKVAKILLQECGVKAHVIGGTALTDAGQYEPHAWNIVCINGNWYHLDITFDNTLSKNSIRYDYFSISTNEIMTDHIIEFSPVDTSLYCVDNNDYYALNNIFFDSVSKLKEYLCQCVNQAKCNIQVRTSKSISEKDVINAFCHAVSSLKQSVCYEQNINSVRNIYAWSIKYN